MEIKCEIYVKDKNIVDNGDIINTKEDIEELLLHQYSDCTSV